MENEEKITASEDDEFVTLRLPKKIANDISLALLSSGYDHLKRQIRAMDEGREEYIRSCKERGITPDLSQFPGYPDA